MADLEQTKVSIENNFKMLTLAERETTRLLERNKQNELERCKINIETRMGNLQDLKYKIQEIMTEKDEEASVIETYTEQLEERISKFDAVLSNLERAIQRLADGEEAKSRRKEDQDQEVEFRRKLEQEKLLEEMRIEMRKKLEKKEERKKEDPQAKLPKLVISKFEGTALDWFRFWNQFEAEIDQQDSLNPVTKYSYLKEFLFPEFRKLVDSLPFTSEGYSRAKAILQAKYGKPTVVANAHINCIVSLPVVYGSHPNKVHDFYEKLMSSVQALETMGKLNEIKGYVRNTLDKLPGIRADLVRLDDSWRDWGFRELVESLRKWTERNPKIVSSERNHKRDHLYHTKEREQKTRICVYCEKEGHKSSDCKSVECVSDRRLKLSEKKLCFNCTGSKHKASDCKSTKTCQFCNEKHHTSICRKGTNMLLTTNTSHVTYPVVVIEVEGVKCRALIDTGAGSSYVSSKLISRLNKKPIRKESKRIETLMHSVVQKTAIYELQIRDTNHEFALKIESNKVEKEVLLEIPNPNYSEMQKTYAHLKDIVITDHDTKKDLPVHVILGAGDYTKIKTQERARVGQPGEPIAELTKLGWVVISPGQESGVTNMMFSKTSAHDYENLCSLDVLGVKEEHARRDEVVYDKFKKQLSQSPEGWYETNLLWKEKHPQLDTNKSGSLGQLNSLLHNLKRNGQFNTYNDIIRDQQKNGIIEKVDEKSKCKSNEYYMPHKAVVRETVQTTKVRIVYDASAKSSSKNVSLNECLETGPPLQNFIWDILTRSRFRPILLCGDIAKAFLQIRIREHERDVLRFHWVESLESKIIKVFRFARLVFGLTQSPFILEGTLEKHFENYRDSFEKVISIIENDMYVDDLVTGGINLEEVKEIKQKSIQLFKKGGFNLHKWHSNVSELESESSDQSDLTYAKQVLNQGSNETKILGLGWNKQNDTLSVVTPTFKNSKTTKRNILSELASVYDPTGLISPAHLIGKLLYREICELKIPWDDLVPQTIKNKWEKWKVDIVNTVEIPRSLALKQEPINSIDLHVFGDASILGYCAVAYAVVNQPSVVNQGLIASKSRLSKKDVTIPRLELIATHMAAKLATNTKEALKHFNIRSVTGWTDSIVVLYWLRDQGNYKVFVENRVKKILSHDFIEWKYVPTKQNPADIGS